MQIETLSRLGIATFALAAFLVQAGADRPRAMGVDAGVVVASAETPTQRGGRPQRLSPPVVTGSTPVAEAPVLTRRGTRMRPVTAEAAPRPWVEPTPRVAQVTARGTRLRPAPRPTMDSAAAVALR